MKRHKDGRRVLRLEENLERLPEAVTAGASPSVIGWPVHGRLDPATPMCFVGSGASLSVAHFGARVFGALLRSPSNVKSPYDYRSSKSVEGGVVLVSASGDNRDILAAFEKAVTSRQQPIIVVTCNRRSLLVDRALKIDNGGALMIDLPLTGEREGFLGIQSLAASAAALLSYGWSQCIGAPPIDFGELCKVAARNARRWHPSITGVGRLPHLVALGCGWSIPALVDLESKCVEGGLGWLEVSETKNFTHGRYVNSYRRLNETAILMLGTEEDEALRLSFLREFGKSLRVVDLSIQMAGPQAGLALLLAVQFVYGSLAGARGMTSDKPPVSREARRMFRGEGLYPELDYRTEVQWYGKTVSVMKRTGREPASELPSLAVGEAVVTSCIARIATTLFKGIACDFDGTLVNLEPKQDVPNSGIVEQLLRLIEGAIELAIVTGRGKSAIAHLREVIPSSQRKRVHCFLYNGSVYWRLDQRRPLSVDALSHPEAIAELLRGNQRIVELSSRIEIASLRTQVTVHLQDVQNADELRTEMTGTLAELNEEVMVLTSGRSVDVFSGRVSKRKACEYFELAIVGGDVLVVGDQGREGGNDVELLSMPNSLSVGTISSDDRSCFPVLNRSGRQMLGPAGVKYLLRLIDVRDSTFTVDLFGSKSKRIAMR